MSHPKDRQKNFNLIMTSAAKDWEKARAWPGPVGIGKGMVTLESSWASPGNKQVFHTKRVHRCQEQEYAQNPCDNKARDNENVHMAENGEINCDMFTFNKQSSATSKRDESPSTELQGTRVNQRGIIYHDSINIKFIYLGNEAIFCLGNRNIFSKTKFLVKGKGLLLWGTKIKEEPTENSVRSWGLNFFKKTEFLSFFILYIYFRNIFISVQYLMKLF